MTRRCTTTSRCSIIAWRSVTTSMQPVERERSSHRVADTFRVISLSFSNLGGPEVVDEYFSRKSATAAMPTRFMAISANSISASCATTMRPPSTESFIELNPFHRVSPHFSMRIVDIYDEAGLPTAGRGSEEGVCDATYALDAEYWNYLRRDRRCARGRRLSEDEPDVTWRNHYHALYQEESWSRSGRHQLHARRERWYRQFLRLVPGGRRNRPRSIISSPTCCSRTKTSARRPGVRADRLRVCASTIRHPRQAMPPSMRYRAGPGAWRTGRRGRSEVKRATVDSSLRFADTFRETMNRRPLVLGAAADDLYEMEEFQPAIDAASKLIDRYPGRRMLALLRSAWTVVGHSSIDLAGLRSNAEHAYQNVLALTPRPTDRVAVRDRRRPGCGNLQAGRAGEHGRGLPRRSRPTSLRHQGTCADVGYTHRQGRIRCGGRADEAGGLVAWQSGVLGRVSGRLIPEHELGPKRPSSSHSSTARTGRSSVLPRSTRG